MALDEAGVDFVEVGILAVSKDDSEYTEVIVRQGLRARVLGF